MDKTVEILKGLVEAGQMQQEMIANNIKTIEQLLKTLRTFKECLDILDKRLEVLENQARVKPGNWYSLN